MPAAFKQSRVLARACRSCRWTCGSGPKCTLLLPSAVRSTASLLRLIFLWMETTSHSFMSSDVHNLSKSKSIRLHAPIPKEAHVTFWQGVSSLQACTSLSKSVALAPVPVVLSSCCAGWVDRRSPPAFPAQYTEIVLHRIKDLAGLSGGRITSDPLLKAGSSLPKPSRPRVSLTCP